MLVVIKDGTTCTTTVGKSFNKDHSNIKPTHIVVVGKFQNVKVEVHVDFLNHPPFELNLDAVNISNHLALELAAS